MRAELLGILRAKSVFHGDFTLSSGAKSKYYIDCRLTTLDARGAWLIGQLMHALVRQGGEKPKPADRCRGRIDAGGGSGGAGDRDDFVLGRGRGGAEDILRSQIAQRPRPDEVDRRQFQGGDTVVVVDDVVTSGNSTITAINAVVNEGGKVAFAAVLVDRQEGGREKIEAMGYPLLSLFHRAELLGGPVL